MHSLLASLYVQQRLVVCSAYTDTLVKMRGDEDAYELHRAAVAALQPFPNLRDQLLYANTHKAQQRSYSKSAKKNRHGYSSRSSPQQLQVNKSSSEIRRRRRFQFNGGGPCYKTLKASGFED